MNWLKRLLHREIVIKPVHAIGPNDRTLIVTADRSLRESERAEVRARLSAAFPDLKVFVIEPGMTFTPMPADRFDEVIAEIKALRGEFSALADRTFTMTRTDARNELRRATA